MFSSANLWMVQEENLENISKLVEKGKMLSHRQTPKAYRGSSIQSRKQVKPTTINSEKKYKVYIF